MRKIALTLTLLATAYACALNADLAQAQPTRVFVAAQGSDGNPCTFALPCRTFQSTPTTWWPPRARSTCSIRPAMAR